MKVKILLILTVVLILSACRKDTSVNETKLAFQMLSEKTWYLDYIQIISGDKVEERNYVGQSTYFINFLKNNATVDSDGIKGTYTVEKVAGQLQIRVQAKSVGSNSLEYIYNIESVGSKNLILFYTTNGVTRKFYYNTTH